MALRNPRSAVTSCSACWLIALLLLSTAGRTRAQEPLSESTAPSPPQAPTSFITPFCSPEYFADMLLAIEQFRIDEERKSRTYWQEETGLLWSTVDNAKDIKWEKAELYCQELTLGEFEDWRLPTIEELESLHLPRSRALYKLPAEIRLSSCCPWSSTKNSETTAWNFSFRFRKRFSGALTYSYDLRALCLRGPITEEEAYWLQEDEDEEKDADKTAAPAGSAK